VLFLNPSFGEEADLKTASGDRARCGFWSD